MSHVRQALVIASLLLAYVVNTDFQLELPLSAGLALAIVKWEPQAIRPEPTRAIAMSVVY